MAYFVHFSLNLISSDIKKKKKRETQIPKPQLQHHKSAQPAVPAAAALLEAVSSALR